MERILYFALLSFDTTEYWIFYKVQTETFVLLIQKLIHVGYQQSKVYFLKF